MSSLRFDETPQSHFRGLDRSAFRRHLAGHALGRVITISTLVAAWCALWREVSVANVLSGLVLATIIEVTRLGATEHVSIRPVAAAQLVWLVTVDLVKSTAAVARAVIVGADPADEAIISLTLLQPEARRHLLLLVVAITVTPGTAVVDADPDTGTLYLHLLDGSRRDAVEAHATELARLACRALPLEPANDPPPTSDGSDLPEAAT